MGGERLRRGLGTPSHLGATLSRSISRVAAALRSSDLQQKLQHNPWDLCEACDSYKMWNCLTAGDRSLCGKSRC
jgi:hypothetical protein